MRGPSAVAFDLDEPPLTLLNLPTEFGAISLVFRTYLNEEGFESPVPRGIWVEAKLRGTSLPEAAQAALTAAWSLVPTLSLSCNAAIGELDLELAFDNTPGRREREYYQRLLTVPRGLPRLGRPIDLQSTMAILKNLLAHGDQARIVRAIGQYHEALLNWQPGKEALVLAHLWMGVEALTKAFLRRITTDESLSEDQLAANWCVDKRALDAEVRLRMIFKSDSESYRKAKQASDGLEHGFMDLQKVMSLSAEARDSTAKYLRRAILSLLDIDKTLFSKLTSVPYDKPLESWEFIRVIRGTLLSDHDDLAAADKEYPHLTWLAGVSTFRRVSGTNYHIEFKPDQVTPSLGEGVIFRLDKREIWGPRADKVSE